MGTAGPRAPTTATTARFESPEPTAVEWVRHLNLPDNGCGEQAADGAIDQFRDGRRDGRVRARAA